ncbi:MAG: hypothetical protein U5Q44_10175 [Dehalococcoidia bacterium]|nr:hypothetical protein [Dehalococcoidia bacterium]
MSKKERAQAVFRDQGLEPESAIAEALAVLRRNGWAAGSLDYLAYEAQGDEDLANGDPEFDAALGLLLRAREAGYRVA